MQLCTIIIIMNLVTLLVSLMYVSLSYFLCCVFRINPDFVCFTVELSRVHLLAKPGETGSDYINASYMPVCSTRTSESG